MIKNIIYITATLFAVSAHTAHGITVGEYLKYKEEPRNTDIMNSYIKGAGDALVMSGILRSMRKEKPLFCQPGELGLNQSNFIAILNKEIKKESRAIPAAQMNDMEISFILAVGLSSTFPCK